MKIFNNEEKEFLTNRVKQHHYDLYIASLFVNDEIKRFSLYAIIVFYQEIAKIRHITNEETIALIRYKWWEERIEEIFSDKLSKNSDSTLPLKTLWENKILKKETKKYFLRIITNKQQDLKQKQSSDGQIKTEIEFKENSIDTVGSLFTILVNILTSEEIYNKELNKLSYSYQTLHNIRLANFEMANGFYFFPENLLKKYRIRHDFYGSRKFLDNTRELFSYLINHVKTSLKANKKEIKKNKNLKFFLAVIKICEFYINEIEKRGFDTLSTKPIKIGKLFLTKIYLQKTFN